VYVGGAAQILTRVLKHYAYMLPIKQAWQKQNVYLVQLLTVVVVVVVGEGGGDPLCCKALALRASTKHSQRLFLFTFHEVFPKLKMQRLVGGGVFIDSSAGSGELTTSKCHSSAIAIWTHSMHELAPPTFPHKRWFETPS